MTLADVAPISVLMRPEPSHSAQCWMRDGAGATASLRSWRGSESEGAGAGEDVVAARAVGADGGHAGHERARVVAEAAGIVHVRVAGHAIGADRGGDDLVVAQHLEADGH